MNRHSIRHTALAITAVGIIAAAAATAQAASITYSSGIASDGSTNVQKFDPGLGTLNSVQIQYDVNVDLMVAFENPVATSQTATILPVMLDLSGRGRDASDTSLPHQVLQSRSLGGDYRIAPAFSGPFGVFPRTTTLDLGIDYELTYDSEGTGGAFTFDKNLFVGTDGFDFDFDAQMDGNLSIRGFGPVSLPRAPTLGGTMTVTYDYTEGATVAVPAPAALPVLAMGLAAFGLMRRRRK